MRGLVDFQAGRFGHFITPHARQKEPAAPGGQQKRHQQCSQHGAAAVVSRERPGRAYEGGAHLIGNGNFSGK